MTTVEDPNDSLWQGLTTDDIIEINRYGRSKILGQRLGRFFPIQGRWFDTFGPGISDGRYVFKNFFKAIYNQI